MILLIPTAGKIKNSYNALKTPNYKSIKTVKVIHVLEITE